jgi:hypothetical protein
MRSARPALVLGLATAVLAAACGSGPKGAAPSATPRPATTRNPAPLETTPAPPTASPSPSGEAADARNPPGFDATIAPLRGALLREVRHKNWHPGCPVPLNQLRVLTVDYHGFDGEVHSGPLVLNGRVVEDVRSVFQRLYRADFRIKHIALARKYKPNARRFDDKRDVTASFNCRPATGNPGSLSQHSYGWAVDINPIQNPYIGPDGKVLRKAAKPYVDRSIHAPGVIHAGDVVVRAFTRIGWGWGGTWQTIKDYMHFSLTGR